MNTMQNPMIGRAAPIPCVPAQHSVEAPLAAGRSEGPGSGSKAPARRGGSDPLDEGIKPREAFLPGLFDSEPEERIAPPPKQALPWPL